MFCHFALSGTGGHRYVMQWMRATISNDVVFNIDRCDVLPRYRNDDELVSPSHARHQRFCVKLFVVGVSFP
jgi:hypothetical protein